MNRREPGAPSNDAATPPSPDSRGSSDPAARLRGVPAPGDVIASKFLVEQVLGVGGMGIVLAARHTQIGQRVAIKFLHGHLADNAQAVERFLREARAAVALSSEHATKVLDVGTLDSGAPYMVMEYLAGVDLGEVIQQGGRMAVGDALTLVLQACEAIVEAHMRGIVHRDLKPSNLFMAKHLDGTPLVKVLDFGISKMSGFNSTEDSQTLTASGSVMGSPMYMSPEQVRNAKTVDARSDIWSLGVILYELLTSETPFAGATLGDTFARILADPPPAVRNLRPDIPEGLAAVIARCLERQLDRRIQTIGELAARLEPFAPSDAALSLQRIARLSRARPHETMTLPSAPSSLAERASVTPPWQSSRTLTVNTPRTRRPATLAAIGATALAVAAVGTYVLTHGAAPPLSQGAGTARPSSVPVPVAASSRPASGPALPPDETQPPAFAPSETESQPAAPSPIPSAPTPANAAASTVATPRASLHQGAPAAKPIVTRATAPSAKSPSPAPPIDDTDPFARLKHK